MGSFCIYCQKEYITEVKLITHVLNVHPGTYAADKALAVKSEQIAKKRRGRG